MRSESGLWRQVQLTGTAGEPGRPVVVEAVARRCPRTLVVRLAVCSGGHLVGVFVPCRSGTCRACADDVAQRRAARRHEAMGGAGLRAVVATVPPGADGTWDHITWARAAELRTLARQVVVSWYREEWGVEVGGYAVVHPAGDRCHVCGHRDRQDHRAAAVHGRCAGCGEPARWRPHVHLGVAGAGVCRKYGKVRDLPRHLAEAELQGLREAWTVAVRRLYASWGVPHAGSSVLHYAYREAGPKTMHRLRYDLRPWPAWHGGQGAKSASVLRLVSFGLAAPNARNKSLARWRQRVRVEPEEQSEPPTVACPCCSLPLDFRGVALLKDLAAYLSAVAWDEDLSRLDHE